MKKLLGLMVILICLPLLGISYLHLNGSDFTEIDPPASIEISADLAEDGNALLIAIFEDSNLNGEFDDADEFADFFGIIDGIPSIGDLRDEYITGDDDSTVNGLIWHETMFEDDMSDPGMMGEYMTFFLVAEDEDGSTTYATLQVNFDELPDPEVPVIAGRVTAADDDSPIEGAMVVFSDMDENEYIGVSDADGHYIVDIPEEGDYALTALIEVTGEFASMMMGGDSISVMSDTTYIDYSLDRLEARIEGTVTYSASGEPVPNVYVYSIAMDYSAMSMCLTDEEGHYSIGQNLGAMAIVQVTHDELEADTTHMVMVTDLVMTGYDFQLIQPSTFIEGHVYYPDSTPVPMVDLSAMNSDNNFYAMTDIDGKYSIRVEPGEYFVRPEYIIETIPPSYEIYVDSSGTTGVDFYLDYGDGLSMVSGNVSTSGGSPVENAYVILTPEEGSSVVEWHVTMTDAEGNYEFEDILPEYWYLGSYIDGIIERDPNMIIFGNSLGENITDQDFVFTMDAVKEDIAKADRFNLIGASPNPFNPKTRIVFDTNREGHIVLRVYDEVGQVVRTIRKQIENAGRQGIDFEGNDLPSGTYFYKIDGDDVNESGKMILIK